VSIPSDTVCAGPPRPTVGEIGKITIGAPVRRSAPVSVQVAIPLLGIPATRPRSFSDGDSDMACERTSDISRRTCIPHSMCDWDTGAGGTEFTTVPSGPRSKSIARQIAALTGTSGMNIVCSVFIAQPSTDGLAPLT